MTSLIAPKNAAPRGARTAILKASPVGCTIITTPKKPNKMAIHLWNPTRSFIQTIASKVVNNGAANAIAIAIASAIGR